ncbi:MAG: YdcF family protein [Flavobacteriales bacterium]
MFFILSKLVSFLLQPLTWVFILLFLAWRCYRTKALEKHKARGKRFFLAAFVTLYVFSNQFLFFEVANAFEAKPKQIESLRSNYQAAIILGGMVNVHPDNDQIIFAESSDRFLAMLPLHESGRIEKLIISGGSGSLDQDLKESEVLENYLIEIGINATDILIDNESRNTYENALYTAELIQQNELSGPFLLSTSAAHMHRADACFVKQDIVCETYPVDHMVLERKINAYTLFIPQPEVLMKWKQLIHEWLGLIIYKVKGYT